MKRIGWCKGQKKGIRLIEPNENLSREYFSNAEESLRVLKSIKGTESRMWLATTKYYTEYFAVYSVLMKLGIKCEIHDCTISLVSFLEKEGIMKSGTGSILKKDKDLRIDNQYYLKNRPVPIDIEKLSQFLLSVRELLDGIDEDAIKEVREKLKKA